MYIINYNCIINIKQIINTFNFELDIISAIYCTIYPLEY